MPFQEVIKRASIDLAFVEKSEGKTTNKCTIGKDPGGKKCVFVSNRFALGSIESDFLKKIGLNPTLRGKLYPYLGKKGEEAREYLASNPLILSDAEVFAINLGRRTYAIAKLITRYDELSTHSFCEIPPKWQSALVALELRYNNLKLHYPGLWNSLLSQDWSKALSEIVELENSSSSAQVSIAEFIEA